MITWPGVSFLPVETELREAVPAEAPGSYSPPYKQHPGHYTTPETYKKLMFSCFEHNLMNKSKGSEASNGFI